MSNHNPWTSLGRLPWDWDFWQRFDGKYLRRCDGVVVLMLDGWRESAGVRAEIRLAGELGKPMTYLAAEGAGALLPDSIDVVVGPESNG